MAQGIKVNPTDEDRALVETLSGYGVPHENICALVCGGINNDTLKKYFHAELARGKAKANAQVGRILFQQALDGNTTSAIWWSKTQMGWREIKTIEVVNDAPLVTVAQFQNRTAINKADE